MSFEFADSVYDLQSSAKYSEVLVGYEYFRKFCDQLYRLQRTINTFEDELWTEPIRLLRHYRFDQFAAPIGFGNPAVMNQDQIDLIGQSLRACNISYPELEENTQQIIDWLRILVEANENPMLDEITKLIAPEKRVAVLLKESRHIVLLNELIEYDPKFSAVQVISQQQLARLDNTFDQLICVGRSTWFKEFILRAPRALETLILRYSWLSDRDCRQKPTFTGWEDLRRKLESNNKLPDRKEVVQVIGATSRGSYGFQLSDEDLIPRFDLTVVAKRFSSRENSEDVDVLNDDVPARLIELEGGRGTFVEADTGSILTVGLDEHNTARIDRVQVNSITPGMFILVRGDMDNEEEYIIPVADVLLGKSADRLRRFQRSWKVQLREIVKADGFQRTIKKLKNAGSTKANEINLRNWLSERNICTNDPGDFFAIMRVIGMAKDEESCWKFAKTIERAHRRAGRKIRQELLRSICEADLSDLEKFGELCVELEGIGGRPMLAVRVVRVSDFVSPISGKYIHTLFKLEDGRSNGQNDSKHTH